MSTERIDREIDDLRKGRSQPDLQMDVLDTEVPTLEGELDINRYQEETEYIDALQGLRELQSGDPVRWKIWRIDNSSGDRRLNGFVAEVGTADLRQELFAQRWGGGKYRIRGTFSNGKFAGGKTIDIAGDVKPLEPSVSPQSSMNSGPQFDMQAFLAMQSAQDARRAEQARQDRKDLLTLLAPIVGSIVQAVVGRPASAAPDMAGLITALRPAVAPPDPTTQMKSMIETMLLMQKLNGGGGDGDSLGSIIAAVAPHAGPVLTALASRPAQPPQRQTVQTRVIPGTQPSQPTRSLENAPAQAGVAENGQVHAPVVAQPTPHTGVNLDAPSQPMTEQDRDMFAQLKPQVDTLVQMAREGADPIMAAQVFFDNVMMVVDDNVYDRLCVLIENPRAIDQLSIFNTGVKERHEFFETFQIKLKELIAAQDQAA